MHAQLVLVNNKIFIKDSKSKFGTLILIQKPYEVTEKPICLQIGRSYLECVIIAPKEYQRLKKEIANSVTEKTQQMKNKQLFRKLILILEVEKPGDKNNTVNKISKNPNMMDIDMLCNNDLDVFVNRLFRINKDNNEEGNK
jgi:hypothetical protein